MACKPRKTSDKVNVREDKPMNDPNTKMAVQALPKMDDIILRMMAMDGKQLRIIFDTAVADYNQRVKDAKAEYEANMQSVEKEREGCNADIRRHEESIKRLELDKKGLFEQENDLGQQIADKMAVLEEQRVLIENMQSLFKGQLDGFENTN